LGFRSFTTDDARAVFVPLQNAHARRIRAERETRPGDLPICARF
jgi:hypothetical protein